MKRLSILPPALKDNPDFDDARRYLDQALTNSIVNHPTP